MEAHREAISYLFWGGMSFVLNFLIYYGFIYLGCDYKIANLISLVFMKLFVFVTNKFFVFRIDYKGIGDTLKEFGKFLLGRIGVNGLDFFGVIFFVEILAVNPLVSKIFFLIVGVLLNYIISKRWVFKN